MLSNPFEVLRRNIWKNLTNLAIWDKKGYLAFFSKALYIAIIFNINYLISFDWQKLITWVAPFTVSNPSMLSFFHNDLYEITEIKFPIMGGKRETHFASAKSPFPDFITYWMGEGCQIKSNLFKLKKKKKLLFNLRFIMESFGPRKHFFKVKGSGSSKWS